jgi:hypothetical protein
MKVDESGAPWPYDAVEPADDDPGVPTWECPGGLCECHTTEGDAERAPHTILFFDPGAKRMKGARCRVLENGELINKEHPYANGGGAVPVKVRTSTSVLELEWAPAELPLDAAFPYRRRYYLDLGEGDNEGARRRLNNLGFSAQKTLDDNVSDFQRTYLQNPTGNVDDVKFELASFHDEGTLPPVPRGGKGAAPRTSFVQQEAAGASPADLALGGSAAPGGKKAQGSAAPLEVTKILVHVRSRSGRDLHGDKTKDEQVNVRVVSGPFDQTKETDAGGFATFSLTGDDVDTTQPPGWISLSVSRRHHGPDLGPEGYGLVKRPAAKEFQASLKLEPPTIALDQPLMLPSFEANVRIKGKDRYVDVVLIDAALGRAAATPGTPARRLDGKQIQDELMAAHVDGDITLRKDFDFDFVHENAGDEASRFSPCTGNCKVRSPTVDRWIALKPATISGVTWYSLLAFTNNAEKPKDNPVTLQYTRDKFGFGRKQEIVNIDQRLVVGLLRICRDIHLRFNIVAAFTQGMEGGDTNLATGKKRTDAHGYGLAVDFGGVSREQPDVRTKSAKGAESRDVKLGVDFIVLYHWGRIEMWDPKLVKENPDDTSKWQRIKSSVADAINYANDANAKQIKLHYRLDPAPLQDDPPEGATEDLKKLAEHFRTAQLLFKAIYDDAVADLSDSNDVLGPSKTAKDTKTEIDANVPHITLHPDYGKPNSPGKDFDGRQAHQNHLHFQLGTNDNKDVVRTR